MRFSVWLAAVTFSGVVLAQPLPRDPSLLKSLTVEQAKAFAARDYLPIGGVTTLSPEVAKALIAHKGTLYLQGLPSLSLDVARILGQHKGAGLNLDGLTKLSPEVAEELAKHPGSLDLNGLTTLSPEVAQALGKHRARLDLLHLTTLSDEAAEALAKHEEFINLPGSVAEKVREKKSQAERAKEEAAKAVAAKQHEKERLAMVAAAEQRKKLSSPSWPGYEDLSLLIDKFDDGPVSSLENFVRYGDPVLAKKVSEGDRFDREEAEEVAAAHRKGLGTRRFWLQREYRWDERDPSVGKEGTVRLRVPLEFRCSVPAHDRQVGVAAYSDHVFWFLNKDGKVQPCENAMHARAVEQANGVLYVPEILGEAELVLWVGGKRDIQKALARQPEQHVVNVGLSLVRLERPWSEGLYKLNAIRGDDYASGSLMIDGQNGKDSGPEGQPNYFVVRKLKPADERSMPEVVSAVCDKVEVVNVAGKERTVVFSWARE